MKILIAIPHTLPAPDGGHGCPIMSWAMVKWLKESGHNVSIFAFAPTESSREPGRMKAKERLNSLGVRLVEAGLNTKTRVPPWRLRLLTARKIVRPRLTDYMPESASYRTEWHRCVEQVQPDALWLYTTAAVALANATFPEIPRLASLVDLDHEARESKRTLRPPALRNRLKNVAERLQERLLPQAVVELLKGCDVVIEHSAASSQWLNENGVKSCYLPNPVDLQPLPDGWQVTREQYLAQSQIKRILMVGHLRGVATQTGLHTLSDEVLPALARAAIPEGWEVHIVGGGELTHELKVKLGRYQKIRLRGYVENLSQEYQRAHLTLVTVSEKLGFRTRLVEAFAYGSPCVVHSSNLYGMPELKHEYNALLSDTGEGLAEAITRILNDDWARLRLETNARRTYNQQLSVPAVMTKMYDMLEAHV